MTSHAMRIQSSGLPAYCCLCSVRAVQQQTPGPPWHHVHAMRRRCQPSMAPAAPAAPRRAAQIVATGLGLQPVQLRSDAAAAGKQPPPLLAVSFVVEGSAAAGAGVREGDVLLSVDGTPVAGQSLR